MARNTPKDAGASDISALALRAKELAHAVNTLDDLIASGLPNITATLALATAALESPCANDLASAADQALRQARTLLDILLDNVSTEVSYG